MLFSASEIVNYIITLC